MQYGKRTVRKSCVTGCLFTSSPLILIDIISILYYQCHVNYSREFTHRARVDSKGKLAFVTIHYVLGMEQLTLNTLLKSLAKHKQYSQEMENKTWFGVEDTHSTLP